MNDFGYNAIGEPVVHWDGPEYVTANGMYHDSVTPVQVVGPGKVAVDKADALRIAEFAFNHAISGEYQDSAQRVNDAVLAAEPAPVGNLNDKLSASQSGRQIGQDSGQGEEHVNVVTGESCACAGLASVVTPAAEPVRVTLPDPITDEQVETALCKLYGIPVRLSDWSGSDMQFMRRALEAVAEPPKADPAETDADLHLPDRSWTVVDEQVVRRIEDECHRAAARGRDEALAEVATHFENEAHAFRRAVATATDDRKQIMNALWVGFANVAHRIRTREQGGDL